MNPAIILARGVADGGLLSAFGALVFSAGLAPGLARRGPGIMRVAVGSIAAAVAALATWAVLLSVNLGGSPADTLAVLRETLFGHVLLAQAALLIAALVLMQRAPWLAAAAAALALIAQTGHGHAWAEAEGPSWLLLSVTLHLLAAGIWLGGLVPLLILARTAPAPDVIAVARRFGQIGTACVLVMAGTALYQSSVLMGPWSGWAGFTYGRLGLLKASLFGILLGLAAINRFRLVPSLAKPALAKPATARPTIAEPRLSGPGRRALFSSIALETAIGLLVILAAGWLASSAPAMDM